MNIRTTICAAVALLLSLGANAQQVMPQTKLTFEVSAVREHFFAGPYAKYAQKYLGVEAQEEDSCTTILSGIKLSYSSDPAADGVSEWNMPASRKAGFETKGVSANYTSEAATLYSGGMSGRLAVSQNMTVGKTVEQRAREAADMVFSLRKNRIQVITGDTDATYSGEAMKAVIDELTALEQEYLSLFLGYSETEDQQVSFELTPTSDPRNQIYVLFRISDEKGIIPADEIEGQPYYLDIAIGESAHAPAADPKMAAKAKATTTVRIPAICDLKVSDGVKPFMQSRIPVYQLGDDRTYPVY